MSILASLGLVALSPSAWAFCGTYVGPVGSTMTNEAAQVILARNDGRTVLTIANDYQGSVASFGLVIPVPEVLEADDVALPDPALFAALDTYSAPRVVSYSCADFDSDESDADSDSDVDGGDPADADGVVVESSFQAGEYDISVLSATGAEGLESWLDANGFVMGDDAAPILQDYIDQGQYFLAAKVDLAELPPGQVYLSPLQLSYESAVFALPIRIGTTVSAGEQEVVAFLLTPEDAGMVGISNFPEATLDDECMMGEDVDDVQAFYDDALDTAFESGFFLTEYAWGIGSCDPCSSDPPDEATLIAAGADWPDAEYDTYITRLRLRYAPEEATQDVMFYESGIEDTRQVRYIQYNEQLEDQYPVCGIGMVEDPGSCDGETGTDGTGDSGGTGTGIGGTGTGSGAEDLEASQKGEGCGCEAGNSGAVGILGWVIGGVALAGRRRSRRGA